MDAAAIALKGRFRAPLRGYDLVDEERWSWVGDATFHARNNFDELEPLIYEVEYEERSDRSCLIHVEQHLGEAILVSGRIGVGYLVEEARKRELDYHGRAEQELRHPAGLMLFARVSAQEMLAIDAGRLMPVGDSATRLDRWIVRSNYVIALLVFAFIVWGGPIVKRRTPAR